jgi:uncharacterized protein (DUF2267 family)
MDEREFAAAVADQSGLAKEEAADLIRATLEALAGQLSGGEVRGLALGLPEGLAGDLPRHDGRSHPVPLADFIRALSQRTGLRGDEVRRGVRAVLSTLGDAAGTPHLGHALSQLPSEYRDLAATGA